MNQAIPSARAARLQLDLATLYTPCPITGCWLWLGPHQPNGYGRVGNFRDPWGGYAHRAVLFFRGERLESRNMARHVRHTCDQRACVNPAHLVYGSAGENASDTRRSLARSGRRWGEWHVGLPRRGGGRPLKRTESVVAYIREAHALGAPLRELAADLGMTEGTARKAVAP